MSDVLDIFKETLKKAGYSNTKVRQKVFEALESQEPQTLNEILHKLGSSVDRASVYRTIEVFEKLGIIQRLQIGWKYKLELTDEFNYHHHHISCVNCGIAVPLREDHLLEATLHTLANEYGFSDTRHQLEIQGLCARCRNAEKT
jgi:Fur family ferric uptake transcriptional regulator